MAKHTAGLADDRIWSAPLGLTPVGFHLRHLAGSTDRLTTYLLDQPLSEAQLAELQEEKSRGGGREELVAAIEASLQRAEAAIRGLDPGDFGAARYVGRRRIRTSAIGLAMHIAEHGQRHLGQIICGCRLVRALSGEESAIRGLGPSDIGPT